MMAVLRRWVCYAAASWAALFAAPHAWWALGVKAGFPGGDLGYDRFMAAGWRYWYDVAVVALSITAVVVAASLRKPSAHHAQRQRVVRVAAWLGASALLVRGLAGMLVDGRADPVWWPTFLLGGLLFAGAACLARTPPAKGV
jgi:hypothetical protein